MVISFIITAVSLSLCHSIFLYTATGESKHLTLAAGQITLRLLSVSMHRERLQPADGAASPPQSRAGLNRGPDSGAAGSCERERRSGLTSLLCGEEGSSSLFIGLKMRSVGKKAEVITNRTGGLREGNNNYIFRCEHDGVRTEAPRLVCFCSVPLCFSLEPCCCYQASAGRRSCC